MEEGVHGVDYLNLLLIHHLQMLPGDIAMATAIQECEEYN